MVRVLLVDDDDHVRRSLRLLLRFEADLEVVEDTATAAAAIDAAARLQPDVVLLDLGLPDLAGRDLLTAIREASPSSRIVVFTGREPDDREFWSNHAAAYVMKGTESQHLLGVLRAEQLRHETSAAAPHSAAAPDDDAVVDEPSAHFEGTPASVPAARAFVRSHLHRWGLPSEDAALVVTELAANAALHAASDFRVRLSRTSSSVRIEVHDDSHLTPEPQPHSDTAEHGRGIVMVAVVADTWGIEPVPGNGKTIWAELPLTS